MHPKPDSARQEIFSSVKNLQAQGVNVGPVGIELSLEERGDRVIATFRDYAGSSNPIETTKLQGTLEESGSECKISRQGHVLGESSPQTKARRNGCSNRDISTATGLFGRDVAGPGEVEKSFV
jgi:hypothetical protein